jgi:hypothetical protein
MESIFVDANVRELFGRRRSYPVDQGWTFGELG